ncbi:MULTISPECIES: ROK family glucokinase [Aerococcus]|uniref:Glucokinase n=2 Tax=Aerococcus TaxID=1375 RepID=A0A178HGS8_9LACT|nr:MULTISPECIES: ROK family glucokinase [Aerococcus]KAA9217950.1 ROK family glucokinase [Aerococcus loyolae]KAA9266393.1 ROK family glucokinase [Aerococcus loyolae]MCY3025108.1 ROK family glucokinase [Aerococcus loyolae]MCY3027235.1 ROK family glucokinase [Aerococcus loyolae]MCY3029199.1 ROK family glucokinase [Aerococcus loyolae]
MAFIVGIDLGGTTAKLALFTPDLEKIDQWQIPTDTSDHGANIISNLAKTIQDHVEAAHLELKDCMGIGMGSPGAINRERGTVTGAYNLGWENEITVVDQFQSRLGQLPVYIENDANVAALGELAKGAGSKSQNMILVTLGTGVGGGIICQGELLLGQGSAGEIGHMTSEVDGYLCTCGSRGCVETLASATGILRLSKDYAQDSRFDTPLAKQLRGGQEVDVKSIVDAAKAGDLLAEKVMERSLKALALCLSQLTCIFNPEQIVLGGGVANAGQYLIDKMTPILKEYTYRPNLRQVKISLAQLGNDAGVIGAANLVRQKSKE